MDHLEDRLLGMFLNYILLEIDLLIEWFSGSLLNDVGFLMDLLVDRSYGLMTNYAEFLLDIYEDHFWRMLLTFAWFLMDFFEDLFSYHQCCYWHHFHIVTVMTYPGDNVSLSDNPLVYH